MRRALVVRLSSLGDVALSSVLFEPLRRAGYEVYLLTYEPYGSLFADDTRVSVIELKRGAPLPDKLKGLSFELILDIHKNLKTLRLRFKIRGRWITYDKDSLRRRLAVHFKSLRRRFYITEAYLKVLSKAGVPAWDPKPKIEVSRERLGRLEKELGKGNFVALGVGARYRKKRYPYFGELARLLMERSYDVVYVGNEEDGRVASSLPGLNLCGRLSLTDVLATLKLAKAFVGNDSGLLHCARAVGTPAVQIYGGTHPTLGFSIYPEEGRIILKNLPCQPCDIHGKGSCRHGDYRCLEIEPQEVADALESLIHRTGVK